MRSWLKIVRNEKGLTMLEIAKKLGISESYYCAIEKGERQKKMDITLISGLSAALGISISDIVEHENASSPPGQAFTSVVKPAREKRPWWRWYRRHLDSKIYSVRSRSRLQR